MQTGTDWDEILLGDVGSRGTAKCKRLAPSATRAQSGAEKNAFSEFFVTEATHRFTHFPTDDFREV